MMTRLLMTALLILSAVTFKAQCSATNSAVLVVSTSTTMPSGGFNYVKVCSTGHAYDTSGSVGGRNYYLEAGGKLTLKMHSTTFVYAKNGSFLTVIGSGSTFLYYETGTTITGTASFSTNCSSVSFPASPACATGVTEESPSLKIDIYPNPAKNKVAVQNKEGLKMEGVIINALGQTVKTFAVEESTRELDLGDLGSGIYYVKFSSNGKTLGYRKLILEK